MPHVQLSDGVISRLATRLADGAVTVLSGAGLSTESGIPDYRGESGRARPTTPMTFQEFVGSESGRQRYWARSFFGWRLITGARPNLGHTVVAQWQRSAVVDSVITQNVDGLHQAAGANRVIELHGGLDRVICLSCAHVTSRAALDDRLSAANPDLVKAGQDIVRPDGDVELSADLISQFRTVACLTCGSDLLKPDVVFFGENVPRSRVQLCYDLVEQSRLLLVLGSSLTVASGFRFVRRAADRGVAVVIVNQGPTRGDDYAEFRLDAPLGPTLAALSSELHQSSP